MEKLKTNLRNLLEADFSRHRDVFNLATEVLIGLENENETPETKIAHSLFDAIWKYSDSRQDINRAMNQLIGTAQREQSRLHEGRLLEIGWINPKQFEEAVMKTRNLWDRVRSLAYISGLDYEEISRLEKLIHQLTEYDK